MASEKTIKIIHWIPRILCIFAVLLISMFALDAFHPDKTIWQQIGDFKMHLTASFILLIFLIVAWKKELDGSVIFL